MAVASDWIEAYLDYTATQESPEIFHRWAGIVTIGAVLNRRVYLPRMDTRGTVYYTNFPGQISPIFVAGSGRAKKSTAINLAKGLMKEAGVSVYDGKITPERLLAKLSGMPGKQAILCAVASELSAFLGKQSYNDGLIDILIKLADCESHPYETQKRTYDLSDSNVCFTLFGGSTPIGLSKAIPPQAQDHGFLSRYIWVYSDKSGKTEPLSGDEDTVDPTEIAITTTKRNSLIIRLRAMTQLNGPFKWGTARNWWNDHYRAYMASPESDEEGWATRKWDHIARVAMVLNIARGSSSLTFAESDLISAHDLIQEVTDNRQRCFVNIGQHVSAENQDRILRILRGQKPVNEIDIYYKMTRYIHNRDELRSQLELLKQAGVIGSVTKNNATLWLFLKEPY